MNILAPVSTYESAEYLIHAGCNEIYLSGNDDIFSTYSFSGRGKIGKDGKIIASEFSRIADIVKLAHENNVIVNFAANTQFMTNNSYKGKSLESHYLSFIEKAMDVGVDSIIVGDLGLLKSVSRQHYSTPIHASVFLKTVNLEQVKYLKEFGVNRVTLSYQITREEIERLCANPIMEYEVVGYLGCSFFNGACGFLHSYGEGYLNDFEPGTSCKGNYRLSGSFGEREDAVFDIELACSACQLKYLDQLGVTALKLVGREVKHTITGDVVKFYSNILHSEDDQAVNEFKPIWWKSMFCRKKSCKYSIETKNSAYTIGR